MLTTGAPPNILIQANIYNNEPIRYNNDPIRYIVLVVSCFVLPIPNIYRDTSVLIPVLRFRWGRATETRIPNLVRDPSLPRTMDLHDYTFSNLSHELTRTVRSSSKVGNPTFQPRLNPRSWGASKCAIRHVGPAMTVVWRWLHNRCFLFFFWHEKSILARNWVGKRHRRGLQTSVLWRIRRRREREKEREKEREGRIKR